MLTCLSLLSWRLSVGAAPWADGLFIVSGFWLLTLVLQQAKARGVAALVTACWLLFLQARATLPHLIAGLKAD